MKRLRSAISERDRRHLGIANPHFEKITCPARRLAARVLFHAPRPAEALDPMEGLGGDESEPPKEDRSDGISSWGDERNATAAALLVVSICGINSGKRTLRSRRTAIARYL